MKNGQPVFGGYGKYVIAITGGVVSTNGLYKYHTFTTTGTLTWSVTLVGGLEPPYVSVPTSTNIDYLVIGGGGGGAGAAA